MLQGLSVSAGRRRRPRRASSASAGCPAFRRAVAPEEFDREERRLRRAAARAAEDLARHSARGEGRHGLGARGDPRGARADRRGRDVPRRRSPSGSAASGSTRNGRWRRSRGELGERPRRRRLGRHARARGRHRRRRARDRARTCRAASGPVPAELPRGSILVADELSPVDAARLDPRRVRALALERGGPTSHASIIARSFGLPAVVGHPGPLRAPSRRSARSSSTATAGSSTSTRRRSSIRRSLVRVREDRGAQPAPARPGRAGRGHGRRRARSPCGRTSSFPRRRRPSSGSVPRASALPLGVPLPEGPAALARDRGAAGGLRDPPRGGGAASGRRSDLRPRRRKGNRARAGENPALGLRGMRYCLAHPELFASSSRRSASPRGRGS